MKNHVNLLQNDRKRLKTTKTIFSDNPGQNIWNKREIWPKAHC